MNLCGHLAVIAYNPQLTPIDLYSFGCCWYGRKQASARSIYHRPGLRSRGINPVLSAAESTVQETKSEINSWTLDNVGIGVKGSNLKFSFHILASSVILAEENVMQRTDCKNTPDKKY